MSHSPEDPLIGVKRKPSVFKTSNVIIAAGATAIVATVILVLVLTVGGKDGPEEPLFGSVASSDSYATEVGLDVLRQGGNAADAVVAMQAVLTLTEPYGSGIGGGMFVLIHDGSTGEVTALDGREEAPFDLPGYVEPTRGGAPTGTPGTVYAMARLNEERGTMNFADLLAPAIKLAREGWVLSDLKAGRFATHAVNLAQWNSTRDLFLNPDGSPRPAGTVMHNPDYADTLETIAANWREFYEGDIARDIVDTVRQDYQAPGWLSMDDMANYRAVWRQPVESTFRGVKIVGFPSPSSGGIIGAEIANILEGFDLKAEERRSENVIHRLYDAMSLAYADRAAYLGDRDWVDIPQEGLMSKAYAAERRALINLTRALDEVAPGVPPGANASARSRNVDLAEHNHTTHYSVADRHGTVIACTSTIENTFGSFVVVPGRGFLLNNELNDFSMCEGGGNDCPNAAVGGRRPRRSALAGDATTEGGKRPLSSMTPSLVYQDGVVAVGSPGGSRIIQTVYNVIINLVEYGMGLQGAVDEVRAYSRNNGYWEVEEPLFSDLAWMGEMRARGFHDIRNATSAGSVNIAAVHRAADADDATYASAADKRTDGRAGTLPSVEA